MRLELKQHRGPDGRLVAVVRVQTYEVTATIRVLEDSEIQLRVVDRHTEEVLREDSLRLTRSLEPAVESTSGEDERPVTIAELPAVPIDQLGPDLTIERLGEMTREETQALAHATGTKEGRNG